MLYMNGKRVAGTGEVHIEYSNVDVDQTYNPESENAQSGKAVAEAVKSRVGIFTPTTEYKVGDIVFVQQVRYAPYLQYTYDVSCICICKQGHKPSDIGYIDENGIYDDTEFNGYWETHELAAQNAERALFDIQDNMIHETYATKNELSEAIGQALESDY